MGKDNAKLTGISHRTKRNLEQRLMKVLFDKLKLKSTMRYSNSHVVGHSSNRMLWLSKLFVILADLDSSSV